MIKTLRKNAALQQRAAGLFDPCGGKRLLCYVMGWVLFATSGPAFATTSPDSVAIVRSLSVQDSTLLRVGERLAVAAIPFCGGSGWSAGMTVQRLSQYRTDLRPAAAAELGLADLPTITHVAAGGAAEASGLRPGDVINAIDGKRFEPVGADAKKGFAAARAAHDAIDAALADGRADLQIWRGGAPLRVALIARRACQVRYDVRAGKSITQASAGGTYIQVSSGLVDFARSDGELAAVLAHELAHHILRHPHLLKAKGDKPSVRDTEVEADRLSVYLMNAAGYAPAEAAAFYTRWGPKTDLGVFSDRSHPGWRKRVALIEAEVARILALKAAGSPVTAPADLQPPR